MTVLMAHARMGRVVLIRLMATGVSAYLATLAKTVAIVSNHVKMQFSLTCSLLNMNMKPITAYFSMIYNQRVN